MRRILLLTLICGLVAAQQTQPPTSPTPSEEPPLPTIRVGVEEVVAPVLVSDRTGANVDGLRPDQFRLYDNGKEQNIHVDVTFVPISMVIAIQANAGVESNRMVDAVEEGIHQLRSRPKDRRRVLLLIGETRDLASEAKPRETLISLQVNNVAFYSVDMSRLIATLTAAPQPGRPDNLPPAMHSMPSNVAPTPTAVDQLYGTGDVGRAEFIPLMVEIFKDVKAIFKANPVELFTRGTGGTEFSFFRQRGLEEAIEQIGADLHSQYLITYNPNNKQEGGFHEISAEVIGHPNYRLQIRPGYWLATKQ